MESPGFGGKPAEDTSRSCPNPSTPDAFYAVVWAVCLLPPDRGRKAIMSRDRQKPSETKGSGLVPWKMEPSPRILMGNPGAGAASCTASSSQAALLSLHKAGGRFRGSPPAHSPVPYQGFLLASLASRWAPSDGSVLCLGQREANLGCYTSHTETVLGPLDLTGV